MILRKVMVFSKLTDAFEKTRCFANVTLLLLGESIDFLYAHGVFLKILFSLRKTDVFKRSDVFFKVKPRLVLWRET